MKATVWVLGAALAAAPAFAADDIYRCVGADGAVAYQQMPCEAAGGVARVPTSFPPVNAAERDRLFEREAAMYQRLEAQRERQLAETLERNSRQGAIEKARIEAAAAAEAPLYVVGYPRYGRGWYGNRVPPRVNPLR
jgi:hypothetical protein